MPITVAQPAPIPVEPSPSEFAVRSAQARDAALSVLMSPEELAVRDARITAATSRLVAFRAARGRP